MKCLIFFILSAIVSGVAPAKILGVFPMVAHSHFTVGFKLMKELSERGHEVTMISPFPQKTPSPNYTDISLADIVEPYSKEFAVKYLDLDKKYFFQSIPFYYSIGHKIVEYTYENKEFKNLINSNQKFDVVIVEQFFNEALLYIAHHLKAPLVVVSSLRASLWVNDYFRNPSPLSHIPSLWVYKWKQGTFADRFYNFFVSNYDKLYKNLIALPKQNEILHKYFPAAPEVGDLMKTVSLILLNSHPAITEPVPLMPNMIEIGGYHVKPSGKLPKDLKEFLDSANEGVVYFCMGGNIKISEFGEENLNMFLRVFSKLKQKVVWKLEVDDLPGRPENVLIVKWAPQQDILAHRNVKLFITHGGLLGTTEAVNFGVPLIGIPIFGDQKMNMALYEKNGLGLTILYKELSEEKLLVSINEILSNPKYERNAKQRSKIIHDRRTTPMDDAVYWVEYVIRNTKCEHFRSSAINLSWIEYNMIDVGLCLICIVILVNIILYNCVKKVFYTKKQRVEKTDKKYK